MEFLSPGLQSIFLTLCIVMDFPIQINKIRKGLSIIYYKGLQVKKSNNNVLQSL